MFGTPDIWVQHALSCAKDMASGQPSPYTYVRIAAEFLKNGNNLSVADRALCASTALFAAAQCLGGQNSSQERPTILEIRKVGKIILESSPFQTIWVAVNSYTRPGANPNNITTVEYVLKALALAASAAEEASTQEQALVDDMKDYISALCQDGKGTAFWQERLLQGTPIKESARDGLLGLVKLQAAKVGVAPAFEQ